MPGTNAVSGDSFVCYNEGRNGAPIVSYVEAKDATTQDKELIGSKMSIVPRLRNPVLLPDSSSSSVIRVAISRGRSQYGGGLGRGDHFLSYKFIERTIER